MHIFISHENFVNIQYAIFQHFNFLNKKFPKGKIWIFCNT
jgi:hypothetical protein